jgi:hypothetical protein
MERQPSKNESVIGKICRDDCGRPGLVVCMKHFDDADYWLGIHIGMRFGDKLWKIRCDANIRIVHETAEAYLASKIVHPMTLPEDFAQLPC